MPLLFDGPAGEEFLARLPQALRGVDVKSISKTMYGLTSARVPFPEALISALRDALIREATSIPCQELDILLQQTVSFERKIAIPDAFCVVLLQAAACCAPQLNSKSAELTIRWLGILDREGLEEMQILRAA
jgi:hypothetical protein